ncbi:KxYKxGKxW signal peptide domain-containing protein [Hutsoniella sourekii]
MVGKNNKRPIETERKSRVKLHKSGKHWVTSCMTRIGLLPLISKDDIQTINELEEEAHNRTLGNMVRTAASIGAILGGAQVTTAFAQEELPVERETEAAEGNLATNTSATLDTEAPASQASDAQVSEAAVEEPVSSEVVDEPVSQASTSLESGSESTSDSTSESAKATGDSIESQSTRQDSQVAPTRAATDAGREEARRMSAAPSATTEAPKAEVAEESTANDPSNQVAPLTTDRQESAELNKEDSTVDTTQVDPVATINNVATAGAVTAINTTGADKKEADKKQDVVGAERAIDAPQGGDNLENPSDADLSSLSFFALNEPATAFQTDNAVANLKASAKETIEESGISAQDAQFYKDKIDQANSSEEIQKILNEAKEANPDAAIEKELTPAEKEELATQLSSAKETGKNEAKAELDRQANALAADQKADPELVKAIQAKIDAAESIDQVNNILSDVKASKDQIFVPGQDTDGRRYFEDVETGKKYYLDPNWFEDSVAGQGLTRWELAPGQNLRVINNMSEPLSPAQLNYKGTHEGANGESVIDMVYSFFSRSENAWDRVNLWISNDLAKSIDWTKSYYVGKNNVRHRFINGFTSRDKMMTISDMLQGEYSQHTPIKLYLRNTDRAALDKIDTTIQSRILDANNNVYTKAMGNTADSNIKLTGYGSYTSASAIPKTTDTNLKEGLSPFLQEVGSLDQAPAFVLSQNNVSYNPVENKLTIASQIMKSATNSKSETQNGQYFAHRLAFDKALLDTLKEDELGFIGYVEPSKTSGAQAGINPNKARTGFTLKQVNVVGNMAYVIYAPNGFKSNAETGQIIYTEKDYDGFTDNLGTRVSDQIFTLTTLNVDSDSLKKLYPTTESGIEPEMVNVDIHSSYIIETPADKGIDRVNVQTTAEGTALTGDKIEIRFAKPVDNKNPGGLSLANNLYVGETARR